MYTLSEIHPISLNMQTQKVCHSSVTNKSKNCYILSATSWIWLVKTMYSSGWIPRAAGTGFRVWRLSQAWKDLCKKVEVMEARSDYNLEWGWGLWQGVGRGVGWGGGRAEYDWVANWSVPKWEIKINKAKAIYISRINCDDYTCSHQRQEAIDQMKWRRNQTEHFAVDIYARTWPKST